MGPGDNVAIHLQAWIALAGHSADVTSTDACLSATVVVAGEHAYIWRELQVI